MDRRAVMRFAPDRRGMTRRRAPPRSRVRHHIDHRRSELAAVSVRDRRGYSIASRARRLSSSAHHARATKRRTASASLWIVVG
jgi:hypothetical protein